MASPRRDATGPNQETIRNANRRFWIGLARGYAGALIFSISLLMTQEMWSLGHSMGQWRLALFTLVTVVLLVGLAHYRGFQKSLSLHTSIIDAFVGYAVGLTTAAVILPLFGVLTWNMPADEIVGKLALQATAGSIGALLARGQLGSKVDEEEDVEPENYWAELFLMIAGSLFVAFTVAPTEEVLLIGYMMTPWHGITTLLLSLVIMHTFVYEVEFSGQHIPAEGTGFWGLFLRFTMVGYALVMLSSLYILWSFGRLDNTSLPVVLLLVVVLSLPSVLGASVARLIL
jgi:putative integral membrane protein (TIGR02587 family)